MAADTRLVALLRSLQTPNKRQSPAQSAPARTLPIDDTDARAILLADAASLLGRLRNHHNVSLLTSHLISSPVLWDSIPNLKLCVRFMSVFQYVLRTKMQTEEQHQTRDKRTWVNQQSLQASDLSHQAWAGAVLKGIGEGTPGGRHSLVVAGMLLGIGPSQPSAQETRLLKHLGRILSENINSYLQKPRNQDPVVTKSIVLSLNLAFPILDDLERSRIDYDRLLPMLIETAFFSEEGFDNARFLEGIDADVVQCGPTTFTWLDESPSFQNLTATTSSPLISGMGPLARLIAHAIAHASDEALLRKTSEELLSLTTTLAQRWRQTKLSEVDVSEESVYLDQIASNKTIPLLWRMLRSVLFSITVVLRAILDRVVNGSGVGATGVAVSLAVRSLHILRHLFFISTRLGSNTFSQYTFVYLAAIDILSAQPTQAVEFINQIRPTPTRDISANPLDRSLDLFFLNAAEHLVFVLPPSVTEHEVLALASIYLTPGGNKGLRENFEAAHSVMLAVFASPQNSELTTHRLPQYIRTLFEAFPHDISSRQFRFAFKTLIRITSPPAELSFAQPQLAETLLELLHERAAFQSTNHQHSQDEPSPSSMSASRGPPLASAQPSVEHMDERGSLVMAILDSLPFVSIHLLKAWLPLATELVQRIDEPHSRQQCQQRFWEVLSSGEMDVERSQICVVWWNTRGGRQQVMQDAVEQYSMSGALGGLAAEQSRL